MRTFSSVYSFVRNVEAWHCQRFNHQPCGGNVHGCRFRRVWRELSDGVSRRAGCGSRPTIADCPRALTIATMGWKCHGRIAARGAWERGELARHLFCSGTDSARDHRIARLRKPSRDAALRPGVSGQLGVESGHRELRRARSDRAPRIVSSRRSRVRCDPYSRLSRGSAPGGPVHWRTGGSLAEPVGRGPA